MARLVRFQSQIEKIKEEYFIWNRIAEENRLKEHHSAVKIQSWLRGCQVRAYLRHLNKKATIIQKIWRGYAARVYFRQMVKTAYFTMKMNFYNEMAVKIQRRWRGFYVRKYVHNYYALRMYLEELTRKNEYVRQELAEFAELQRMERERFLQEREKQKKRLQAQRMHFLLSTKQIPGIFNSPHKEFPHEMELRLKSIRPLLTNILSPRKTGASFDLCATQPLPPIPSKKPQGPFRDPEEVLQQRYRPLEPSLRVATSITDAEEASKELCREEWRGRIIEDIFRPFSNAHKNKKYEKMLDTTTSFEPMAYGTKHFREVNLEKIQGKKPFNTVFTTTHVFDKFGRLYSNAGKIV